MQFHICNVSISAHVTHHSSIEMARKACSRLFAYVCSKPLRAWILFPTDLISIWACHSTSHRIYFFDWQSMDVEMQNVTASLNNLIVIYYDNTYK
jgi:hypothetical protein